MDTKTIALNKAYLLQFHYVLPVAAFAIPFFIAGPQLLTGTLVNSFLILYALVFPRKNILPIVILPSIGAVANGVLFGVFTPFLLYFIPFIWLGNSVLIKAFQKLNKIVPVPVAIVISGLLKTAVLYVSAQLYFSLKIVPSMFVTAMGLMQLYTALAGGILALIAFKALQIKYE